MFLFLRRRGRVKTLSIGLALVLTLVPWLPSSTRADDRADLSYDIYSREDRLTVWVDLSPFVDADAVARLEDGIDFLIECQVSLSIPRKIFGDKLVVHRTDTRRVGYHSVTEEYQVTSAGKPDNTSLSFVSLADLYEYFRDSIEVNLGPLDSLKAQERYVLGLDITTISLTDLNLAPSADSTDSGESPLRFLFRQFLNLTDYGREEFSTKSRPFSLDEIGPEL